MSSREVEVKGTQAGGLVYPELIKPVGGSVNPENHVEVGGPVVGGLVISREDQIEFGHGRELNPRDLAAEVEDQKRLAWLDGE